MKPENFGVTFEETEKFESTKTWQEGLQGSGNQGQKRVPVVVGALGLVSKKQAGHLEQLGIKDPTRTMQKSALLGSSHILRKVLEVSEKISVGSLGL